jgi:hypothetical protein
MSESAFSNTDSAAPLDTIPPVVTHTPVTSAPPGMPLTLFADVTDNVGVQAVTLCFRTTGTTNYSRRAMTWTTGARYAATVEGANVVAPGLEYYLEASDGITIVRSGRPEYPWPVTVVDRPVVTVVTPNHGPAAGGTPVTIASPNFRSNATVSFGGVAARNVVVVSANQITCTTASHFPAAVGLITPPFPGAGVVWDFSPRTRTYPALNANQTGQDFTAILLGEVSGNWSTGGLGPLTAKAVRSASSAVTMALRAASVRTNESRLWLLLNAPEPRIYSVDATLEYDPAAASITGSQAGPLAAALTVAVNTNQAGVVRLGFAGAAPVQGVGGLLALSLLETAVTGMRLTGLSINEGAVPVEIDPTGATFDGDTDGDGQSDWAEVLAGTDPQDRASVFALGAITVASDQSRTVTWSSVPGHGYRLVYRDAVVGAPWVTVGEEIVATGKTTSHTDRASRSRAGWYQVRLVE